MKVFAFVGPGHCDARELEEIEATEELDFIAEEELEPLPELLKLLLELLGKVSELLLDTLGSGAGAGGSSMSDVHEKNMAQSVTARKTKK